MYLLAMHPLGLLEWHSMIFLLPFGVSVLLLLLSSLSLGHRSGTHGHAHAGHAHTGHTGHAPRAPHAAPKGPKGAHQAHRPGTRSASHTILSILGLNRAPVPLLLQAFFVCWGLCGMWANRLFLEGREAIAAPGLRDFLPSLGLALLGGLIGARVAAAILSRLLPRDETSVVSRDELFGSIGQITFAASDTGGRIHIYDEHGSLHDEICRTAPGRPAIPKGRHAMVLDIDEQGRLLVEPSDTPASIDR